MLDIVLHCTHSKTITIYGHNPVLGTFKKVDQIGKCSEKNCSLFTIGDLFFTNWRTLQVDFEKLGYVTISVSFHILIILYTVLTTIPNLNVYSSMFPSATPDTFYEIRGTFQENIIPE